MSTFHLACISIGVSWEDKDSVQIYKGKIHLISVIVFLLESICRCKWPVWTAFAESRLTWNYYICFSWGLNQLERDEWIFFLQPNSIICFRLCVLWFRKWKYSFTSLTFMENIIYCCWSSNFNFEFMNRLLFYKNLCILL